MTLPRRTVSLLVIAVAALAGGARADDLQTCQIQKGDVTAACTRAIESGRLSRHDLAVAYMSRGREWRGKDQPDRAIADYSAAIRADPSIPDAWYNRANSFRDKEDKSVLDLAIADYTEAIRLRPNDPDYLINRGLAYQDKGDQAHADADLAAGERLKKQQGGN